jgi:hypothetical protein
MLARVEDTPSKPHKSGTLPAPRWLTRAEKAAFHRIVALREAAGKSNSEADIDPICDLISLRSRIGLVRKLFRNAATQLRKHPAWSSDQALLLASARQIDSMTDRAWRMARTLGIGTEL